ncbi:flavin reductase family protein [Pantoea sp.]|uniref:flavin reductase family protein n=1 Tax=Pantoea sp. TaxID=69393 RepID=UPI0031D8DE36
MTDTVVNPITIADAYRGGMRQLAAGVCLITAQHAGQQGGMIATAVTSVSAEPPTLLVCVNRSASMFAMIAESGRFCVNVLAADALPLVDIFSNSARREERFQSGEWLIAANGSPVCAESLVSFECRLAKTVDWHTHAIFLGEVTGVLHPRAEAKPLVYLDRGFHQLAGL